MGKRQVGHGRATTPADAQIGRRIRARRTELAMSQTALADAIGVTFQQVQKYERGANRIAVVTLLDIADALKVAPMALLPSDAKSGADEAIALDDPDTQDIARTSTLLNAEGRRVLLLLARALSGDENLRRGVRA